MARRNAPKDWACQECGRRFTLTGAEVAARNGCKGCGGVDIDLAPKCESRLCEAGFPCPTHRDDSAVRS